MPRSSTRHDREIYGYDSAGETAEQHGETFNNPTAPEPVILAVTPKKEEADDGNDDG